jgi:hypothetical protein
MDENAGQKNSPAYRLAALDPDFLLGDSTRGVRLHLEYEKAEGRLRAWVGTLDHRRIRERARAAARKCR